MVRVDVIEGRHRLGRQVLAARLDVDDDDGQRGDVVLLGDEEQHVAAPAPRRLDVHGLLHVVGWVRHHPAEDAHAVVQRSRYRVVLGGCNKAERNRRRRRFTAWTRVVGRKFENTETSVINCALNTRTRPLRVGRPTTLRIDLAASLASSACVETDHQLYALIFNHRR